MKSLKFASLILLCATSILALVLPALGVVSFPEQFISSNVEHRTRVLSENGSSVNPDQHSDLGPAQSGQTNGSATSGPTGETAGTRNAMLDGLSRLGNALHSAVSSPAVENHSIQESIPGLPANAPEANSSPLLAGPPEFQSPNFGSAVRQEPVQLMSFEQGFQGQSNKPATPQYPAGYAPQTSNILPNTSPAYGSSSTQFPSGQFGQNQDYAPPTYPASSPGQPAPNSVGLGVSNSSNIAQQSPAIATQPVSNQVSAARDLADNVGSLLGHNNSAAETPWFANPKTRKVGTGVWLLLGPVWIIALILWSIAPAPNGNKTQTVKSTRKR